MLSEKEKLESLTSLGIELNRINDLDILLERILTKARQWVNADAGSIYICDEGKLNFVYTQNITMQKKLSKGEKLIYSTFSIPIDDKVSRAMWLQQARHSIWPMFIICLRMYRIVSAVNLMMPAVIKPSLF